MPNLFDMLANAQDGRGMELLARQFNLSQQQAQLAVEALLPAVSQGLKRNTADPYGIGAFMSAMATGQHAKYVEDAQNAFSPQGVAEGNGILGHLFGSKDLSRAVAAQAAQATGIGQDVLKQMLPVIASMVMGGLAKQSNNQLQAGGFGGGSNPLGDIIEQMMRQGGGLAGGASPQQPQAAQPDNPFGKILEGMFDGGAQPQGGAPGENPLGKILEGMFGGQPRQAPQPQGRAAPSPYDNPFGKILEEMMGGGQRQAEPEPEQPEPEPQPRRRANPQAAPKNPYDDIFGKMFETGAKQRDDYQKGVESIFEQFSRGMDRHR